MLDGSGRGEVKKAEMRSFLENCVGLSPGQAMKQAESCDLGGGGMISYRDFRKCFNRLDSERLENVRDDRAHEDELHAVNQLRLAVRAFLEIVDQPPDSADHASAVQLIEAALRGRGMDLNSSVHTKGLQDLLGDLRLPPVVAEPVTRAWVAVRRSLAHAGASSSSSSAPQTWQQSAFSEPTYENLLDVLRRAFSLLRSNLNDFYGACHAAHVDLKQALDKYQRRSDATVTVDELAQALVEAGARFSEGELDDRLRDVLQVHDPHNWDVISAPELIRGYEAFKSRHGALLKALASRLSSRGLTPDELFARASGSKSGVREGVLRSLAAAAACH